jgi:heavy metal translocating P-type ATPase
MRQERTLSVAVAGLIAGIALTMAGAAETADVVLALTVLVVLVPTAIGVARMLRRGDLGVDAIAVLAMAGALLVGEELAGAVVALMLTGGNALERFAVRRARRELTALTERAPRIAHRFQGDVVEEVPVGDVAPGDRLLVRGGDVVPADGVVEGTTATLDTSALTGEPLPRRIEAGHEVQSGVVNAGAPFVLRVTRAAADSAYAALVRLVESAERQRAPFVRMADRYAVVFLAVTVATAGIAWLLARDPVRAVAVLVVATPCPLILAAPIALIAGVSRAAKAGIVVKGGAVIERLAEVRAVLFDKTGTITRGAPELVAVEVDDGADPGDLLRLAASVDQQSPHVAAEAIVHAAEARSIVLSPASAVVEAAGEGIEGTVEGHRVVVGRGVYVERVAGLSLASHPQAPGQLNVHVAIDGAAAGRLVLADRLRPEAPGLVASLRAAGVRTVALVTGDDEEVSERIGAAIGADAVFAEQRPADKVSVVERVREHAGPVLMVGDGVNDAPALARADVGVAMGTAGATVASETADAVIMDDRVDRVATAIAIGRRSMSIARQSVLAGVGLSCLAMAVAAAGYLPPVAGALVQEVIDVAVILNALRALRPGSSIIRA